MTQPIFPGISKPTSDFEAVRDMRRTQLFYYDVDLTNARSIGAGTMLILNLAGNSFYIDQDTNAVGYATVHFQDTNLGISPAPIYVGPGFIANIPFTQLLIENIAQAGKRLRIFYGVDVDFQAGVNAQVSINGTLNAVLTQASLTPHIEYAASYKSITNMAANTPDTIFTPAANANGAIVWRGEFSHRPLVNEPVAVFVSKNAAPANVIDGDVICCVDNVGLLSAMYMGCGKIETPIKIAAGKGLYYICTNGDGGTAALRSCLYTLL